MFINVSNDKLNIFKVGVVLLNKYNFVISSDLTMRLPVKPSLDTTKHLQGAAVLVGEAKSIP